MGKALDPCHTARIESFFSVCGGYTGGMKRVNDWVCGWDLEREARGAGARWIAGVDEVGRGPLFGPVVAAAVVLPESLDSLAGGELTGELSGLTDSKRLSAAARERLEPVIRRVAVAWAVAEVDAAMIDRINIREASRLAMRRAVERLSAPADFLLVDGNCAVDVSGLGCGQRTVVKGDARSLSIAAASVVAKVYRDRLMEALEAEFPGYGIGRHKGYPTAEHRAALERLGATGMHRRSFGPVRAVCEEMARVKAGGYSERDLA